jgi:hypothetical protein
MSAGGHQAEMFDHQAEKCNGDTICCSSPPSLQANAHKTYLPPFISAEQVVPPFVVTFFFQAASPMLTIK